jgi:hypothetical protein
MGSEILKLGYEVSIAALARQDAYLASLRNRATAILSVATVGPSVAATVGFFTLDPSKSHAPPAWAPYVILGLVLTLGLTIMGILLPVRKWHHAANAEVYLYHSTKGTDDDDFCRRVIVHLGRAYDENQIALNWRVLLLNVAIVLLVAMIAVLILATSTWGGYANVDA